jgi:hypothetical protein
MRGKGAGFAAGGLFICHAPACGVPRSCPSSFLVRYPSMALQASSASLNRKGPHFRDPLAGTNLFGMKSTPRQDQISVFHRAEYPDEYRP